MKTLTLVYAYYENPTMLNEQLRIWGDYPDYLRRRIEVIVTDDASPRWPARITRNPGLRISLYRIENDVEWNWLECRNIGAKHAVCPWLLLTDMDHALYADQAGVLVDMINYGALDEERFYTLERRDAPDLTYYKFHPDSYLMTRDLFWRVGGYDEHYAGNYGTSGLWRRRCLAHADMGHLDDAYLVRYPGEYMPDARTTTLPRKEGRDPHQIRRITERLDALGVTEPLNFAQPYHLVQEYTA